VVRAAFVLSIGSLATAHSEATAWLEQVLAADEPDGVRVAAALGIAWSIRSAISEVARALLTRTAVAPGAAKDVFAQFPWDEADVQAYSRVALVIIGEPAQSLPTLIKALDDVAQYQSWGLVLCMLQMVFAGQPKPATASVNDLTTDQRAALFAIAQSQDFWASYFIDAPQILRCFGLPGEREELRAFLDGNRTAS